MDAFLGHLPLVLVGEPLDFRSVLKAVCRGEAQAEVEEGVGTVSVGLLGPTVLDVGEVRLTDFQDRHAGLPLGSLRLLLLIETPGGG